ncbi:MAG: hypothetical protein U0746_05415 [Gemmataceae bacterium]
MALRNWLQSLRTNPVQQTVRKPRPRLRVQLLEDRAVPAAGFLSAFTTGGASTIDGSNANDVAVDAAGNTYLTGSFIGTIDFEPTDPTDAADTLTARGSTDAFVAKYAPNDTLVWVRRMGGDAAGGGTTDCGRKLAIDASGNAYVTGQFKESGDFGPFTLTSAANQDGFVMKLDASGGVAWAKSFGAGMNDTGLGIGVDAAGNVYALGVRTDPAATTTVSPNNGHDIFKFSPAGTLVWTRSFATRWQNSSGDMAVDAAGNVYAVGSFQGAIDFDPGNGTQLFASGYWSDAFVLKLTSAGNYGWATTFYGLGSGSTGGYSHAQSVALDGAGNVIVSGYYGYSVDFNPGRGTTTLPSGGGAFITKLSNKGALVWAKALELVSSGSTMVYGLAVDSAGSIYATGSFSSTVDFDPGIGTHSRTSSGASDVFVVKVNSAGTFQWAETIGGTSDDFGWGVAVSSTGVVHLTGSIMGTVDFDPDPLATHELSVNRRSLFLLKLNQS